MTAPRLFRANVDLDFRTPSEWWKAGDADFNEEGDLGEPDHSLVEHPPLTFHESETALGFKTIAASSKGLVDKAEWSEISSWVAAKKLPDGTQLETLKLIAPARTAALALQKRARAAGIAAVLYADNDGTWWDPSPPGDWIAARGQGPARD